MWDNWNVASAMHKRTIDHPELYDFIDLSQNSHTVGHRNWINARSVFNYISSNPRPVNSTKIYGRDKGKWNDRGITTKHAIHTFCRNIMEGFASSRFHRPYEGLGLSDPALYCIKTIREIERKVKFWELNEIQDLSMDGENEAYLRTNDGEKYIVYLPEGGKVTFNLKIESGNYALKWISTDDAIWTGEISVHAGDMVELDSNSRNSCFGFLILKN
jgi:hypothetical protein